METVQLRREMTRVAGALFALGAGLLALATVVPTWPGSDQQLLLVYAALAALSAVGLELAARYRPLTVPQLMVVAVLGITIVTLVVLAGGPQGSGSLAVFHVFVVAYGFFYFPRWWAVVEVALIGAAYGGALVALDAPGGWSQWILVTGSYAAVGAIFGTMSQRVRHALVSELESVHRLQELDEMKTTFLRAVSHELRTPLTSIVGYTTTLRTHRQRLTDEQTDDLLDRAVSNARKLEQMLLDLLDLDRVARGVIEPKLSVTDVGALVRRVIEHIDLRDNPLSVSDEPAVAAIDASKVERIVENLIVNAIKHTPPRTPVRVEVRDTDDGVLLVVEDDGQGVPDSLKQAMFEPFRQGHGAATSATPGTGIGLSLVQQFTLLHGGRAWIEDSASGGARFLVLLPRGPVDTVTDAAVLDDESVAIPDAGSNAP